MTTENQKPEANDGKRQSALPPVSLLGHVVTEQDIEKTKDDIGSHATHEMLMIAALCRVLAQDTHDHAQDLAADGFTLKAEEADQRAETYTNTYWAICHEWPVA